MPIGAAMIVARSTIVIPSSGRPGGGGRSRAGGQRIGTRGGPLGRHGGRVGPRDRRGRADHRRGARQLGDRADRADRAVHRVVERDHVAGTDDVGVLEALGGRQVRLGGDVAVRPEDLHPLVGRPFEHARQHQVAGDLDGLGGPCRRRTGEALVGEQVTEEVDRVEVGVQQVLEQVAELDPPPVGALHRVVVERRHVAAGHQDVRCLDAAALGHLDEQQLDEVERQQPLEQAGLDALEAGAAAPGEQRGDDALHRTVGGDVTADRHGRVDRTAPAQLALERHHPPGSCGDGTLVAGHLGQRSARPPAGDRAVHERRVQRRRGRRVDAPPHGARRRAGDDQHVGGAHEVVQHRPAVGGVQVGGDAALAAQPQRRGRRARGTGHRPAARP